MDPVSFEVEDPVARGEGHHLDDVLVADEASRTNHIFKELLGAVALVASARTEGGLDAPQRTRRGAGSSGATFVYQHTVEPLFRRFDGGPATGSATPDDHHIGFQSCYVHLMFPLKPHLLT